MSALLAGRETLILVFFSTEVKLSKFCLSFTPDSASTPSLEITQFAQQQKKKRKEKRFVLRLVLCRGSSLCGGNTMRKMKNPDSELFLSVTVSLGCGCVATSKHFFHACLSAARRLEPPTVNLPARCEGQTRAAFLQTRF